MYNYRRYIPRLLAVFLLNAVYVALTIFVFMMIEPFVKLLFRGNLEGLSPISSYFVSLLSGFLPMESQRISFVTLVFAAVVLFMLRNLSAYASQWVMAHVRSDFLYRLRNQLYDKMISLPLGYFNKESNYYNVIPSTVYPIFRDEAGTHYVSFCEDDSPYICSMLSYPFE